MVVSGQDHQRGNIHRLRYGRAGGGGVHTIMASPNTDELISFNDEMDPEARIGSAGMAVRPVVVENFAGEINLSDRRRMASANYHGSVPRGAKY